MAAHKDVLGESPGSVIPGCNSQIGNPVGVHWIRISFDYKDLSKIEAWVSNFYGESDTDDYGLWSYDRRKVWKSGVSLCFDSDPERCRRAHQGRITLDLPGGSCDELTASDLSLFIEGCREFGGKCSRIDIFFDDYSRIVAPKNLHQVIDRGDYSMFRIAGKNQTYKRDKGLVYDAVTFGRRGSNGSGKFLRIYDKNLESDGEYNCVRYECEFSQEKAQKVFTMLASVCGNLDAFATICGALIGGCIAFIHRTGDKNINRLSIYEFWRLITKSLGKLSIRIAKKQNTLTGMMDWQERQVSPTLACVRKVFRDDQNFFNYLQAVLEIGESRMNASQCQIAEQNAGCLVFNRKINQEKQDSDYLNAMCIRIN